MAPLPATISLHSYILHVESSLTISTSLCPPRSAHLALRQLNFPFSVPSSFRQRTSYSLPRDIALSPSLPQLPPRAHSLFTPVHHVAERLLRTATITITTVIPITTPITLQCHPLRLIVFWAIGTDWLGRAFWAEREIWVVSCPGTNIQAVSEDALVLCFAARRKIAEMDAAVKMGCQEGSDLGEWLGNRTSITRWDELVGRR